MANIRAIANGNWSNNAIWSPAPPTSVDDVFASGFTVYVDTNIQVISINTIGATGIGGGGTFRPNNGVVMTTNVVAGSTTCVTFGSAAPNAFTLFGSVSGGNATNIYGINNTSSGLINITGNIFGGTATGASGSNNNSTGVVNVSGDISSGTGNNSGITNSSTGTFSITGNVFGGSAGSGSIGADNTSNGILTIIGNVAAGITHGVRNNGNNTLTITGNVTGSPVTSNVAGAQNQSTGTLTINGNVFAQAGWGANNASTGTLILSGNATGGNNTPGVINSSTGTVIVYGNVFGTLNPLFVFPHYGAQNNSTGTLIVSGNAVAGLGNTAYGAFNNTTGILRVKRAVGNDWGLGYTLARAGTPGVFSNAQGSQTFVEELECGPRGQWPTGGVIFFTPNTRATSMFETDTFQNVTLIESNSADNLLPPVSSVRQGTTYNLGLSTGTCIIPPTSSVALNTLVDNLTGTAALTPQTTWNFPVTGADVNSMGGRLRNALNTNSANSLINSFNP